jgi:hypothetical protein
MSYTNNGYERTLYVTILTYTNGVNTGSVVESGLCVFPSSGTTSYSGATYGAISVLEMGELDEISYEARMNDFCDYLQIKYSGLIISNRAVNGNTTDNDPRRLNSGACPITIAQHDIFISSSLIYLYGITPDIQNITMSSTDYWNINGLPSIVSVTPTSGDNTVTQLQCTRTNWGNDTLTIQNLYNSQVVSCTIQALYLTVTQNTVSLSDTSNTSQIGISIAGGLDNYNIIKTGDTGYFTVTKGSFTPGNTITATSITVTSITSSQNRSLTITLQHVSNSLVQQIITITYTPTPHPSYIMYMGQSNPTVTTSGADALEAYTASRAYYKTAIGGNIQLGDVLYDDEYLTERLTGFNNYFLALKLNGEGTSVWVKLDAVGTVIAIGTN